MLMGLLCILVISVEMDEKVPEKNEKEEVAETVHSILLILEKDRSDEMCTDELEEYEDEKIAETEVNAEMNAEKSMEHEKEGVVEADVKSEMPAEESMEHEKEGVVEAGTVDSGDNRYCPSLVPGLPKRTLDSQEGSVTFTPEDMEIEMVSPSFTFTKKSSTLLERVARCVANREPVLLVNETGTEKIPVVQYLANLTQCNLTVINVSQPNESVDSITSDESIDLVLAAQPLKEKFIDLFLNQRIIDINNNSKFLGHLTSCLRRKQYAFVAELLSHAQQNLVNVLLKRPNNSYYAEQLSVWKLFGEEISTLKQLIKLSENTLFKSTEKALIKAMKNGEWLLLDADAEKSEAVEFIAGILERDDKRIFLQGKDSSFVIHPKFQLFISMNMKSEENDLPVGIRNRFSEIYISDLQEISESYVLVQHHLENLKKVTVEDVVKCYLSIKEVSRGDSGHYADNRADTEAGAKDISQPVPTLDAHPKPTAS